MLTSKPMCKESKCKWGCITWCRSCIGIKPCVCVCVCVCASSQDLQLAVKQALELFVPSSLQSSRIQNFIVYSLFSMSLFFRLCCCQLWLLFLLQLQYKSRKRKKSSSNLKTQETNKQKKPNKLKAKKNLPFSTLSDRKQFFSN